MCWRRPLHPPQRLEGESGHSNLIIGVLWAPLVWVCGLEGEREVMCPDSS